jgi:hypothetical protein
VVLVYELLSGITTMMLVVGVGDKGTGKGRGKIWDICDEIEDRIWMTLVGIILGPC